MTISVEDAEAKLASSTALLGSELVPTAGLFMIRLATDATRINKPGIRLCIGDALRGGGPAPMQCFGRILWQVDAVRKEKLSIALGGFLVTLGSRLIPLYETRPPFGMTPAEMEQTELVLCLAVALFRRLPIISSGISEIGENAMPAGVK